MKKLFIITILPIVVCGCCDTTPSNNPSSSDESFTNTNSSYKIKPIIYYHGKHYIIVNKRNKLPQGYHNSGDKIIGNETDENTVPNRECYTLYSNRDYVGSEIINNPNDERYIFIKSETKYLAFQQQTNQDTYK